MKRSLVVEDDELTAKLLIMILEDNGYIVDWFPDGHQAIEAAYNAIMDKDHYKLILCDIMIPNLDGHSVIIKIRELEKNANLSKGEKSDIFIVSSIDDPTNVAIGKFKGQIAGYITKPFSRADITNELVKLER